MAKNEDGEYELVLGNHQLLGVFFIVVMLLAVMFALGYIVGVGRNSTPVVAGDSGAHKAATNPIVVDSPAPHRETASAPADAPPDQPITTQPQTSVESPKPQAAPAAKPAPRASGSQPVEGATYLQLTAIDKATADLYVDKLHKKKFDAIAAQVPEKPDVYRVLVGPIADGQLNKTKSDLVDAGFPELAVKLAIKRSF